MGVDGRHKCTERMGRMVIAVVLHSTQYMYFILDACGQDSLGCNCFSLSGSGWGYLSRTDAANLMAYFSPVSILSKVRYVRSPVKGIARDVKRIVAYWSGEIGARFPKYKIMGYMFENLNVPTNTICRFGERRHY